MIHLLTMGHLDAESVKDGVAKMNRPLDRDIVSRLLGELGETDEHGRVMLGGFPVQFQEGYLACPWLVPMRNRRVEEFARRLVQETGCVLRASAH